MKIPKTFIYRAFIKNGQPIHLIFFITSKCNLRCSHCFFHKAISGKSYELTFSEIEKIVSNLSPTLSVNLTGGEPFLREDLYEIVRLFNKSGVAEFITIITNGFNTDHIVRTAEKIVSKCFDIRINMGVSIDGFEEHHDKFRNKKGSYKNAIKTINSLKILKQKYSNFDIGIVSTLHQGNQYIMNDFRKSVKDQLGISPGITIIRGDSKSKTLKEVNSSIYRTTIDMIEKDRQNERNKNFLQKLSSAREILGYNLAYQSYVSKSRTYDCYAGTLMGVIYENGDVYPCEMLPKSRMGNLREFGYNLSKLWRSPESIQIREQIMAKRCHCTYECQYTCNTLYNPSFWPFLIKQIYGN